MSKLNPQNATAYVGPGVLRKGGKITKVPNGPLIKKTGKFKGSTLKAGGRIKKAENGVTTTAQTTEPPTTTLSARDKNKADLAAKKAAKNLAHQNTMDSIHKAGKVKVALNKVKDSLGYASRSKNSGISVEKLRSNDKKLKEEMAKKEDAVDEGSVKCDPNFDATKCPKARAAATADKKAFKKKAKSGAMLKHADGSTSKRGLWDNIRANKGSGKKPTKQMLVQEKKIKAKSKK